MLTYDKLYRSRDDKSVREELLNWDVLDKAKKEDLSNRIRT